MTLRRVVVTGVAGISPIGNDWPTIQKHLRTYRNAVSYIKEWDQIADINTRLAAQAYEFDIPEHINTGPASHGMGMAAKMAVLTTELALQDAGLLGSDILSSGDLGVAYGACTGAPEAYKQVAQMLISKDARSIDSSTYLRMISHTAPVNISGFFNVTGRTITTSSACTSSSQAIGYAYEFIKEGKQKFMIAGGSEELHPMQAAVFDTLFATSTKNSAPETTPAPFDASRDGLVLGEGSCTLILEDYQHALERGARIYAEIVGYGTNSDGMHVTNPNPATMQKAMELALEDAGLPASSIGYINAHGTATANGDRAESSATHAVFGKVPISSLKSYTGHTLGACGALEAWVTIEMMREGWFAPTLNLHEVDPLCGDLDYIIGSGREIQCEYVMSNNFAFGGINTSLIFKKYLDS